METNKQVAEAWANGKRARSASMYSDGVRLYSYFTCIAERWNGETIFNATRYSVTTSCKHYHARNAVAIATKEVKDVPIGTHSLVRFADEQSTPPKYGSLAV